jgi:hypothetical protein
MLKGLRKTLLDLRSLKAMKLDLEELGLEGLLPIRVKLETRRQLSKARLLFLTQSLKSLKKDLLMGRS